MLGRLDLPEKKSYVTLPLCTRTLCLPCCRVQGPINQSTLCLYLVAECKVSQTEDMPAHISHVTFLLFLFVFVSSSTLCSPQVGQTGEHCRNTNPTLLSLSVRAPSAYPVAEFQDWVDGRLAGTKIPIYFLIICICICICKLGYVMLPLLQSARFDRRESTAGQKSHNAVHL